MLTLFKSISHSICVQPQKVVIMLQGRYAGKKAVIVKPYDDGSTQRKYGHALVCGLAKPPRRVGGGIRGSSIEADNNMAYISYPIRLWTSLNWCEPVLAARSGSQQQVGFYSICEGFQGGGGQSGWLQVTPPVRSQSAHLDFAEQGSWAAVLRCTIVVARFRPRSIILDFRSLLSWLSVFTA